MVRGKARYLNKHNKQSQRIWETLINTVTCSPKTEPKVAKKFKRKSSIPIQIWLSKMLTSQSVNTLECRKIEIQLLVHFHLWSFPCIGHVKDKVIYSLCCYQKGLNGKSTKLHTVTASNNRDHMSCSFYFSLCGPHIYIWVLFFTHITFVINRTCNTTLTERLQPGTEFTKKLWGDESYSLRFDDVTMFDLFVKLAKCGTHRGIYIF